jgi:hypothetical protein
MTEPVLPKRVADFADSIVDVILDLIDAEPDPVLRRKLLRRAKAEEWDYERHPGDPSNPTDGGHCLVRFGTLREYVIPLVRVGGRRLDA